MPEYVYALFEFAPENPDEINFKAGDRIEVVEKDDVYGDGWWQGRTDNGNAGLFPQSFTTPNPPVAPAALPVTEVHETEPEPRSPTVLQTLREGPESSVGSPKPGPTFTPLTADGEVMHATLTDVQKAIEQLGRHDGDGSRSFSFASSRGEGDDNWTDRDSATDTEGEVDGWHLNARQRLAENSRIVNEKSAGPSTPMRVSAPPIEVELSDESEAEDDDHSSRLHGEAPFLRRHPHIPEEEEDDVQPTKKADTSNHSTDLVDPGTPLVVASDVYIVPSPEGVVDDLPTATLPGKSFLKEQGQEPSAASLEPDPAPAGDPDPESEVKPELQPEEVSPAQVPLPTSPPPMNGISSSVPPSTPPPVFSPIPVLLTSTPSERTRTPVFHPFGTPSSSATSIGIQQALETPTKPRSPIRPRSIETPLLEKPASPSSPPSKPTEEWTVEEVVDWLKGKGIDQSTCDKFIEQDITGDVLLELDLELLKSEIGIVAFGKRKRIANAIAELKKPPTTPEPIPTAHPESFFTHSRSISSIQGTSLHSPSLFSSAVAPVSATGSQTLIGFYQSESPRIAEEANSLPPDTPRSAGPGRESDSGSNPETLNRVGSRSSIIGLGIQLTSKFQKSRPTQLNLSPSGGSFGGKNAALSDNVVTLDDDRAVMSEGELPTSVSKNGKETISTPISLTSTKRDSVEEPAPQPSTHRRSKRSLDGAKASDRLSLFGSAFGGTIGKSRKPPPRYSTGSTDKEDDGASTKGEKDKPPSTFSRLYHMGDRKTSISRQNVGELSAKQVALDKAKALADASPKLSKEEKDRALLRKRGIGGEVPRSPIISPPVKGPGLVQGRSVLEQIGTPDFNGWLMKRGEHYNIWKNRYCVLKGHNLYWMRSNSATETKIKGYINVSGYKIIPSDEVKPGSFGFKMEHSNDKTHMFYSDTHSVIREWMKALMKSTIERDYSQPVSSTATVPTIPLDVAQAMNPPPRPPSPGSRAATQRAMRRPNPNQLSSRDAQVLLLGAETVKGDVKANDNRVKSFLPSEHIPSPIELSKSESYDTTSTKSTAPPRPVRNRLSSVTDSGSAPAVDQGLIDWANSHLSPNLQFKDISDCSGLNLMRIAESIRGKPASPPVPDSSFPSGPSDDKLDGLFSLFDFLLNNDVHLGTVSINDVRQGKKDKILQVLKALKSWEDKRKEISQFLDAGLAYNSKSYLSSSLWTPVT